MAYNIIESRKQYNNANITTTLSALYNADKVESLAKITEKNDKGVVSVALRQYYADSVARVDGMAENNAWVKMYLINTIVSDKHFKDAYKDRKDLAAELEVSESTICNALKCVTLREELVARQFGSGYTASQVQELIPHYNKHDKIKQLDVFWNGVKDAGICNSMSAKDIRAALKDQFTYVTVKPETKTEKPETKTEKPETKTEKPETKTEKPETKTETESFKPIASMVVQFNFADGTKAQTVVPNKDEMLNIMRALSKETKDLLRISAKKSSSTNSKRGAKK